MEERWNRRIVHVVRTVVSKFKDYLQISAVTIKLVRSEKLPYEILPTPNSLISTLAASGFPADRFAIEYFPSSLETLFCSRASMKMAIAIIISSNNLSKCFDEIIKAYGQSHLVYI